MPDTTTYGVPYLLGTDPAADIAAATQALAEFLEPFIFGLQAGSELIAVTGSGADNSVAVVFARPYVEPPMVVTGTQGQGRDHWATNITETGFTLHASKASAGATNYTTRWVAVGQADTP